MTDTKLPARMILAKEQIGEILANGKPVLPEGMLKVAPRRSRGFKASKRLAIAYAYYLLSLKETDDRINNGIKKLVAAASLRSHALPELALVRFLMPRLSEAVEHRTAKILNFAVSRKMSTPDLYEALGKAGGQKAFIESAVDRKTKEFRSLQIDKRVSKIKEALKARKDSRVERSSGKATKVKPGEWIVAIGRRRTTNPNKIYYYHLQEIDDDLLLKLDALLPTLKT
jgi:hypothetical protein